MTYRVLTAFTDLRDNGFGYEAGDIYPRLGYKPEKARIEELSTDKNRRGFPLIEEIQEKKPERAPEVKKNANRTVRGAK